MKLKLSIILPIYNGEKTLSTTLNSLVKQSFQDFELIACIDGTKDQSKEILLSYQQKFKSLLILENEKNIGLGPTMNRLVANSKGEYIAIAEQDDYYYENRLQLQIACLESDKSIGLVSGIAEFYNGKEITMKFPGILVNGKQYPEGEQMFLLNYTKQIKVANSCIMFRKTTHINNGLYFTCHHPSISVDWTYILRFSLISKIYGLPNVLVRLDRRGDRNSVTSNKTKQFRASRELIRSFAYEFPDIISSDNYKYAMRTQYLMEMNNCLGIKFILISLINSIKYPMDNRFRESLLNRLKKKF